MKIITGISISLLLISQTGCVQTTNFSAVEQQLKIWEKSQEYGRSLDTLSRIDPRDPDYAKAARLRKQIEKEASAYEQQVRKEIHQKLKKGNWASALNQYDDALSKYPRSAVIKDGLAKLNQQQRDSLDVLERKRLIQHGEWLRAVIPVYRDIVRVDPRSSRAQNQLDRIISEAVQISSELTLLGNKALADNDLDIAEETLPLAVTLDNHSVTVESLKILRAQQKLVLAKQEKKQRRLSDLIKNYDAAIAARDLTTARNQLMAIEKLDRKFDKLATMKAALKTAMKDMASRLFETGVSAYSRGEFELAAKEWSATLKLDASHQQAKENLRRVGKVMKNLERLKVEQGS